jgi:deoxyribonuclease V
MLLVNATGRDHPRRGGLAVHLDAVFGVPTVGVTIRPRVAQAPGLLTNAAPLRVGTEVVGYWVQTRAGAKPVAVHAAWQTNAEDAVQVVLAATCCARTPEALRRACTLARTRRARSGWTRSRKSA